MAAINQRDRDTKDEMRERIAPNEFAQKLVKELKVLLNELKLSGDEVSTLSDGLKFLQRIVKEKWFYIWFLPLLGIIVTVFSILFSVPSPTFLHWKFIWYVCWLGIVFLAILWVYYFGRFPGDPKKLLNNINKVANLLSDEFREVLGSAAAGIAISNFQVLQRISRGDEDAELALNIHESIIKNVQTISRDENAPPIISFESREQNALVSIEEMLTDIVLFAIVSAGKEPFGESSHSTGLEICGRFSCNPLNLWIPDKAMPELNFQELFNKASVNYGKYASNRGSTQYLETNNICLRTRVLLCKREDKVERMKFIRFCFWPRNLLLSKEIQCYIEMQEIAGIPTFWIERNDKNIKIFCDTWNEEFAKLNEVNKQLFAGINYLSHWNEQIDFFIGPYNGFRGYRDGAMEIGQRNDEVSKMYRNLICSIITNFSESLMWAKDIAWLEFAERWKLTQFFHAGKIDWNKINDVVRNKSGFILGFPMNTKGQSDGKKRAE